MVSKEGETNDREKKKNPVLISKEALKYCLGSMQIWAI